MMSERIPLSHIRPSVSSRFLTEESTSRRSSSPHDVDDSFLHSISLEDAPDTMADTHPAWKRELYSLLEQPTSSQSAFIIHILMTGLIILSAIVTVMETVPAFHYVSPRFWFGLESSVVALFTVEYIARSIAWSGTWMGLFRWITCASSINFPQKTFY